MDKFESFEGTCITGNELNSLGLTFVKITRESMNHHGFQLCVGENEDTHELTMKTCSQGGLYFCPSKYMSSFIEYGNGYHYVTIDDNERVFIEQGKAKAKKITLSRKYVFNELSYSEAKELIKLDWQMYGYINDDYYNDEELCKIAVFNCGLAIKFMTDEMRNNKEICKIAANNNGRSIIYMSEEMKNNEEICKIAANNNGISIKYMSEEMKNDEEICKIAANNNGISIKYMSKEMQNNKEICKIAAANYGLSLSFMSDEIKNNEEVCKIALANDKAAVRYIGPDVKNNEEIAKYAVSLNGMHIIRFNKEFRDNIDICKIAIENDLNAIYYASNRIKNNPEICEYIIAECHKRPFDLRKLPLQIKNNIEICKIAVTRDNDAIHMVTNEMRMNIDFCVFATLHHRNNLFALSKIMRELVLRKIGGARHAAAPRSP